MKNKVHYLEDWLQGTTPHVIGAEQEIIERSQKMFGDIEWQYGKAAQRPYTVVLESKYASIHWNPERPEFKYMLRMSGQNLDAFRREGGDVRRVMVLMAQYHFTVTRIDIARDIFHSRARPAALYNKWRMGELKATSRKITIVQSQGDDGTQGETVYFGGRSSNRFLRVYDKAAQVSHPSPWVRAELELKGANAEIAAHQILQLGLQQFFQSQIASIILSGMPSWLRDDNVEIVALEAVPRKVTNHERWIFDVVVPAIYKALAADIPGFRSIVEKMLQDESLMHSA